MVNRLVSFFEILILLSCFLFLASFVITTTANDAIIDNTERFVELVRYKGCITADWYDEFLRRFQTPVNVRVEVLRKATILTPEHMEFTGDITKALGTSGIYTMNIEDEINVIVRKSGSSFYDRVVGMFTAGHGSNTDPAIAVKGGMILNTQY